MSLLVLVILQLQFKLLDILFTFGNFISVSNIHKKIRLSFSSFILFYISFILNNKNNNNDEIVCFNIQDIII